jgi:hypothetical protein
LVSGTFLTAQVATGPVPLGPGRWRLAKRRE